MPLDRTWYDTLVDDDGSNLIGTLWNKAAVDSLMDAIDAYLTDVPLLSTSNTFNAAGADRDFVIESPNSAFMFALDGGTDKIGLGAFTAPASSSATVGIRKITGHANVLELFRSSAAGGYAWDVTNSATGQLDLKKVGEGTTGTKISFLDDGSVILPGLFNAGGNAPTTSGIVGGTPATPVFYQAVEGTSGSPVSGRTYNEPLALFERWDSSVVGGNDETTWSNASMIPLVVIEGRARGTGTGTVTGLTSRVRSTSSPASGGVIHSAAFLVELDPGSGANRDAFCLNPVVSWQSGNAPANLVCIEADVINTAGDAPNEIPGTTVNYTAFWAQVAGGNYASSAFMATAVSGSPNADGWWYGFYGNCQFGQWAAYFRNTQIPDGSHGGHGLYVEIEGTSASDIILGVWADQGNLPVFQANGDGTVQVVSQARGTGNITGPGVHIGRNSSGNGAAGWLDLLTKSGAHNYVWADDSAAPGMLRISTVPPDEDGTPADTSGTVIGTQTSTRDTKEIIGQTLTPVRALKTILAAPVQEFRYKGGAYSGTVFHGIVADEAPAFAMDPDARHPEGRSFNPVSAFGYTVQAIKALEARLAALERKAA